MYFNVNGQDIEASIKPIAGTVRLSGEWQYACTCVQARTCMSACVCLQGGSCACLCLCPYLCSCACVLAHVCVHVPVLSTQKEWQGHRMRLAIEKDTRFYVESLPINSCRCPDFSSGCLSDSLRPKGMAWLSVTTILLKEKTAK